MNLLPWLSRHAACPACLFNASAAHWEKEGKPLSREWERSPETKNRRLGRKAPRAIKENRFILPDEAVFVHGHTQFLHGPAGGTCGGINVAADGFHVLAHSANRMAGNTPKKGGDTQNNQFGFHRFIGRVPNNQTPFLQPLFKEPMIMPHCPLSFSVLAMRTRNT